MLRDETIQRVLKFRDDRDWRQFHTPKDLAISMSLEAAELLEIFQWSGTDVECREKLDKVREELADVLMYYGDVLLCYGITPQELKTSYEAKFHKNMERW